MRCPVLHPESLTVAIKTYSECSGGNHITVTMDDGSVRSFDKSEFFASEQPDEAREVLKAAIVKQGAVSKEQVDWSAVKAEVEK